MFTGIIQELGTVVGHAEHRIEIHAPDASHHDDGASIAVNGVCLTIAARPATDVIAFDLLPDTLAHTTMGELRDGDRVNLEPAAAVGQPLGGHWVQGHVDDVGTVRSAEAGEAALDLDILIPPDVLRLCIERGSICVNGVSLTIMSLGSDGIRCSLIPETCARTNLGAAVQGTRVNLEADVLARYIDRLLPRSVRNR